MENFLKSWGQILSCFWNHYRSLSNAEDERDNIKELNDKLNSQILELASKFQNETEELHVCKKKLQEADNLQQRLEQEIEARQEMIREAQEKETKLLAQVSDINFFVVVNSLKLSLYFNECI